MGGIQRKRFFRAGTQFNKWLLRQLQRNAPNHFGAKGKTKRRGGVKTPVTELSANKDGYVATAKQIAAHRKIWNDLILNMSDGDVVKMQEIKRMDAIREFWQFFDFWREKQQQKLEQLRKTNQIC